MSLLSWLKKNTARDDAWITVHPNAGGKGSPVLLDDEGYIKGGMGGKFTGQRIDLMPRKTQTMPESGLNATERIKRYNLKNGTKRELLETHFSGVSDLSQRQEIASAFYYAPDDLIRAISNKFESIETTKGTGDHANNSFYDSKTGKVIIGENDKAQREQWAKDGTFSHAEYKEYNNFDGQMRHEFGHALDDKHGTNFFSKKPESVYAEEVKRYMSGELNEPPSKYITESGKDGYTYASTTSKDFIDGVKATQSRIWQKDGTPDPKVIKAFGLLKSNIDDEYVPNYDNPNAVLAKCAPLSDTLSALTGGKLHGFWDHGADYWNTYGDGAARTEIFANLTNIYASPDRKAWEATEQLFPELASGYKKVLAREAENRREKK